MRSSGVASPGEHLEHRCARVHARDLGLAVRAQVVARVPQPDRAPGAVRPARPARWSAASCDTRSVSRRSSRPRVEAHDAVQAGVHDGGDPSIVSDVSRCSCEDDLPCGGRRQGGVLLLGRERAVERQDRRPRSAGRRARSAASARISGAPGRKTSTCPPLPPRALHASWIETCGACSIATGCGRPSTAHDGGPVEERRDRLRVERRRHDDEPEVVARAHARRASASASPRGSSARGTRRARRSAIRTVAGRSGGRP
jgi:hypothetical protein